MSKKDEIINYVIDNEFITSAMHKNVFVKLLDDLIEENKSVCPKKIIIDELRERNEIQSNIIEQLRFRLSNYKDKEDFEKSTSDD